MNIWNDSADIEGMTSNEWLNYRDDLLDEFYRRGYVLQPNPECKTCDSINEYVCFDCELQQIEKARNK